MSLRFPGFVSRSLHNIAGLPRLYRRVFGSTRGFFRCGAVISCQIKESSHFLKKAAQKLLLRWASGVEAGTAQTNKVYAGSGALSAPTPMTRHKKSFCAAFFKKRLLSPGGKPTAGVRAR